MSPRRGPKGKTSSWVIEVHDDDSATVLRHGRPVRSDANLGEALRYVRKRRRERERIFRRDPDGYLMEITRAS